MTKQTLKAFTLIELLIVIVIIGILAVALIPRLTGSQAAARDTARKASVQQVATAVAAYMAENPNTDLSGTGGLTQYLSSYPSDPKGGAFTISGNNTSGYAICATTMERPANGNSTTCPANATFAPGVSGTTYVVIVK